MQRFVLVIYHRHRACLQSPCSILRCEKSTHRTSKDCSGVLNAVCSSVVEAGLGGGDGSCISKSQKSISSMESSQHCPPSSNISSNGIHHTISHIMRKYKYSILRLLSTTYLTRRRVHVVHSQIQASKVVPKAQHFDYLIRAPYQWHTTIKERERRVYLSVCSNP